MIFASLLFVFFFLTLNLCSQVLIPSAKGKNIAMLFFSLIFYTWTGVRCLVLMLLMVFICKVGAIAIENAGVKGTSKKRPLFFTVAACLTILGIFKYTGFTISTIDYVAGLDLPIPEIVLPIGISFYTFQLISYVVDVYREEIPAQKEYWRLLLYACLFHQCIAGPIIRYQDVHEDLMARKTNVDEIGRGISRFCLGLMKKAVFANGCAVIADRMLDLDFNALSTAPALGLFLGLFAFGMQIYMDFSGYSDMAIGMGLMCGLHYKENFNFPFISKSIAELWKRWHISLSTFFRDYVYIPLGGGRCSPLLQFRNLFIVWFLTGLWHGAEWNYVLWGLYFGMLLAIKKFIIGNTFDWLPSIVQIFITFFFFLMNLVIFKYSDITMMLTAFKSLFCLNDNPLTNFGVELIFKNNMYFLILCTLASTPFFKIIYEALEKSAATNKFSLVVYGLVEVLLPIAMFILAANALAGDSYNPFIYFQF